MALRRWREWRQMIRLTLIAKQRNVQVPWATHFSSSLDSKRAILQRFQNGLFLVIPAWVRAPCLHSFLTWQSLLIHLVPNSSFLEITLETQRLRIARYRLIRGLSAIMRCKHYIFTLSRAFIWFFCYLGRISCLLERMALTIWYVGLPHTTLLVPKIDCLTRDSQYPSRFVPLLHSSHPPELQQYGPYSVSDINSSQVAS